jgi:glycosyltransferase involved in cell wall biosynthesis
MRFSIIVPTKDRPEELRRFLKSVELQDVKPEQIVIVDGSDRPVRAVVEEFKNLPIDYVEVRPPGLVKQRHVGINTLKPGIPIFGFFDDDIVLEPGAFRAMSAFWDAHFEDYGGFGMNIVNAADVTYRKHGWYLRLFMIRDDRKPGSILKSCRSVPYSPCDSDRDTEWLCGGATFWKREIFDAINYDPWFKGWGMSDDLEFSIRVGKKHRLAVVAGAKVHHLETPTRGGRHFLRGYIGAMNTMRIADVHPEYSVACAAWSWFGQGTARIAHGLITFNTGEALMGTGHLAAVGSGLLRGFHSLEAQVKQ